MTGHVTQNSGDDEGGHVLRLVTVLAPEVKYLKTNDCKTHGSFFVFVLRWAWRGVEGHLSRVCHEVEASLI